jgi:hypothetical protein
MGAFSSNLPEDATLRMRAASFPAMDWSAGSSLTSALKMIHLYIVNACHKYIVSIEVDILN